MCNNSSSHEWQSDTLLVVAAVGRRTNRAHRGRVEKHDGVLAKRGRAPSGFVAVAGAVVCNVGLTAEIAVTRDESARRKQCWNHPTAVRSMFLL